MHASASCLRLFRHWARAAASRTFCTAGTKRPIKMAMMAMTTSSSISVKARRRRRPRVALTMGPPLLCWKDGWREEHSLDSQAALVVRRRRARQPPTIVARRVRKSRAWAGMLLRHTRTASIGEQFKIQGLGHRSLPVRLGFIDEVVYHARPTGTAGVSMMLAC